MKDAMSLDERMKVFYEGIPQIRLIRRMPVIIRIDGKAFHTFLRGFEVPFDDVFISAMQNTAKYLCEHIQGCVLAYTESDEISLILVDYQKLDTDAWFDNEVQKICSVSASMATMAFNRELNKAIPCLRVNGKNTYVYEEAVEKGAMFDARCFNIPKEEVTNYIYWRQRDASRNSVQMVGRAYFSHSQLKNKNNSQIQDMLMEQHNVNWNNFPTHKKRGTCVIRDPETSKWVIDMNIPIFKGEDREYIERTFMVGE